VPPLLARFTIVVILTAAAKSAELQFSAEKPRIAAGESTTLTWKATPGQKTILLGTGDVAATGSLSVSPSVTSNYTLLLDTASGLFARTLTIEVTGARGTDFPADEEQFRYPLSDQRAVRSPSAFLQEIFRLLQNDLAFSVRTYTAENGVVVFLTNLSTQADLISDAERRRLRARRIAYRLEVADRSGQLAWTVKSLIESQLRAEETWRKESDEALYQRKGRDLLSRLAGLP